MPFLFVSGTVAIVAAVVVGVALFATGTTVGVLTSGPLLRRGLRQLGIGVAAAAVTYGLGRVFGTVVGCPTRLPITVSFQVLSAAGR